MKLVKRAAWGARPAVGTGNELSPHPSGVAIHWSGSNVGVASHDHCGPRVMGIQRFHQVTKGWSDIAYSYLVCQHGFVYEGRGIGKGSAANGTTKANLDYYAVCALMGPKDTATVDLIDGIGAAINACRGSGAKDTVLGHRDLYNSECPGKVLYDLVKTRHWIGTPSAKPLILKPTPRPAPPKKNPPKPISIPVANRPPQIAVSGMLSPGTKRRLQQWAGVNEDGNLGPISWRAIQTKVGHLVVDGNPGEKTWKAIQRMVGVTDDGNPGPITIRALQNYLNKH